MALQVKRFQYAKGAIYFLEKLALSSNDMFIFRGEKDSSRKLLHSWQRLFSIPHENWNSNIDETLTKYSVGLEKLGIKNFDHANRIEALENGRHFGVPTPCLDFTYSPYIAMYFAFNGVEIPKNNNSYSVVYALNINQLAEHWALQNIPRTHESFEKAYSNARNQFLQPGENVFNNGFPANTIQFIPFPGKTNKRMQRQLGCLLYDTYSDKECNLECYIEKLKEKEVVEPTRTTPGTPTLYKVLINHKAIAEVFNRLELMNISGGNLFDSSEGVAQDVKNTYYYNPKFLFLRDVESPTTKI